MSETNFRTEADAQLHAAGERMLEAAMAYWKEYCRVTKGGSAVVWLQDDDGRMVVLTRGEYRDTLMANIDRLRRTGPLTFDKTPESAATSSPGQD